MLIELPPRAPATTRATTPAPAHGEVLRFITCGSVDDGKSTLIGRLLYDTRAILEDQLAAVERASKKRGMNEADLSLLTDGLEAEREQGITIDVAYRYFATAKRKFIIADTPGHVQYTRNMATGASTAHAAIVVADVTKGLLEQGRRHLTIAHLLGIREIVVAVNKMDLVDYDRASYERVRDAFVGFSRTLASDGVAAPRLRCIPLSALRGDMIVDRGDRLAWFHGPTLLEQLESLDAGSSVAHEQPFRFAVQLVQRSPERGRSYLGRVASGSIAVGDRIAVLPSGVTSTVRTIHRGLDLVRKAAAGDSIALTLDDELDVSRGDMFGLNDSAPTATREFEATLVWLSTEPLSLGKRYAIKHTTRSVKAKVVAVHDIVDIAASGSNGTASAERAVGVNDIARVRVVVQQPLAVDRYRENRATGAFILIDETTHHTVAAGMVE